MTTEIQIEKAIRFLAEHMPVSDDGCRKPILFHDIRVGVYLYEAGYKEDIVLAGILHDAIEWSKADIQTLRDVFGDNVATLVLASTKNDSILDRDERIKELIRRCIANGQGALIVKTADIIDSFKWYSRQNNVDELRNHCVKNANAILASKPDDFDDKIFLELKKWQENFIDL